MTPVPSGGSGGGSTAGSNSQTGGSTSDAGTSSTGGGGSGTGGTSSNGGTFNSGGSGSGGTFNSGGTMSTGGTFASSGTSAGGSAGMTGGGGASAGSGGGSGAGGGGSANGGGGSGAGGKSGVACKSEKLTPTGATASGSERADLGPQFAIDGDTTTTRWGSDTKNDGAWLMVDMGEPVTINRVVLVWEAAYATGFKLQAATSAAGPFTDFYSTTSGAGGTADLKTFTPATGRYVRMQGVTRVTMYGYSLFDFSVYGDKDETCD